MMTQAASRPGDDLTRSVLAIVSASLALSLGDAVVKRISVDFPIWQLFVLRSLLALPVLLAIAKARAPRLPLWPRRPGWTAVRSLTLVAMWLAYYAALPHVNLGVAAAAYYTLPIFIALFAALFLGERVGPKGWAAVAIGFGGTLLVLRPDSEDFSLYALLPLAAAILYASAMLLTRTKCREERPLTLSLTLNVAFVAAGACGGLLGLLLAADPHAEVAASLVGRPTAVGLTEWGAMLFAAAAVVIGSVGAAVAYQVGPPVVVASIDFSYVAFATTWGVIFFGERPSLIAYGGVLMIIAAGLIAVRR